MPGICSSEKRKNQGELKYRCICGKKIIHAMQHSGHRVYKKRNEAAHVLGKFFMEKKLNYYNYSTN